MAKYKQSTEELIALAEKMEDFNDKFSARAPVTYYPIQGCEEGAVDTITNSVAWITQSGKVLVMIKGKTGGVSIDHIEAR